MENAATTVLKESNPWAISVRLKHYNTSKTSFQIDHDFRDGKQPSYVDESRKHLNSGQRGMTVEQFRDVMLERRKLTKPERPALMGRAAVMTGGIITFGHLAQIEVLKLTFDQRDSMYIEIGRAIADRLENELSGWAAHRDEDAPHGHFELPSRRPADGLLMSEVLKPSITSEIQDIAASIAQKYAPKIQRGEKKANTKARNKSVKDLHRTQAVDIAARQVKLDELDAQIIAALATLTKNEQLAEDARIRATRDGESAEKARKLVTTYERRSQAARDALVALEGQVADLRAAGEAMTAQMAQKKAELDAVSISIAQKKTKIASLSKRLTSLNAA